MRELGEKSFQIFMFSCQKLTSKKRYNCDGGDRVQFMACQKGIENFAKFIAYFSICSLIGKIYRRQNSLSALYKDFILNIILDNLS